MNDIEQNAENSPASDTQVIFAERSRLFMNQLSDACTSEGVTVAYCAVLDPKLPGNGPIQMFHGNKFELAKMLTETLRRLKAEIFEELDV